MLQFSTFCIVLYAYSIPFVLMAIWCADAEGIDQTEPVAGCYYGIFTAPPAVIASRLPRPPSPFVDNNDFSSKQQSLPSFAVMFSGLSEPDVDFDCSIRQTVVEMSVC
jgi:hypothetical protein